MASVDQVGFALARFEATEDERLEVVGRWQGLEGRRLGRPTLTVTLEGGRRRRLTALPGGQLMSSAAAEDWRASFAWDGDPATVESAELELGRRLVVELPRPRRRRRRTSEAATPAAGPDTDVRRQLADLRTQIEELRAARDAAQRPLAALREEREQLEGDRDAAARELAALREEQAGAARDAEEAGAVRGELELAQGEIERLRSELYAVRSELERAQQAIAARDAEIAERDRSVEAAVAALEQARREHEEATTEAAEDAARRVEAGRAEAAELREKLAAAREEAETARREAAEAITAEAAETERLRNEARAAREEADRTVTAERAEAARLREELADRPATNGNNGEGDPATRRMLERVTRDLERERAASRTLRRELEELRGESAEHRRLAAAAAAVGVTSPAEAPDAVDRRAALREEAARVSTKRVDAAARAAHRVPEQHQVSTPALWAVRLVGVLLAGLLLLALAIILFHAAG